MTSQRHKVHPIQLQGPEDQPQGQEHHPQEPQDQATVRKVHERAKDAKIDNSAVPNPLLRGLLHPLISVFFFF